MFAKTGGWAVRLLAIAIIAFLCMGWWASRQADYYQVELGAGLRSTYGFAIGTPMIRAGGELVEVLAIYPDAGSPFAAAGVREGDIIVGTTLTGFYRQLHEAGGKLRFEIVRGGDGAPVEQRKKMFIEIETIRDTVEVNERAGRLTRPEDNVVSDIRMRLNIV